METICEIEKCTGCGACLQICPKNCISMEKEVYGFYYPLVNQEQCVNCLKCKLICPQNNVISMNFPKRIVKVSSERIEWEDDSSSSGGTASRIIIQYLNSSGIVYSTSMNQEYDVSIVKITNPDQLKNVSGSKYVQSSTLDSYASVMNELSRNNPVLYIGTPCQIAGLKSYLGKDHVKLFTIDLLCAGVGSPFAFHKYINSITKKYGEIDCLNFRNKKYGYGFYLTSVKINGKIKILKGCEAGFSECIGKGLIRLSCMTCPYHSIERTGDLTLGDYGREFTSKEDKKYGANIVFINSDKGEYLINLLNNNSIQDINADIISKKNKTTPLNSSKQKSIPSYYKEFYRCLNENGWNKAYKKFIMLRGTKGFMKKILPLPLYYKFLNFVRCIHQIMEMFFI